MQEELPPQITKLMSDTGANLDQLTQAVLSMIAIKMIKTPRPDSVEAFQWLIKSIPKEEPKHLKEMDLPIEADGVVYVMRPVATKGGKRIDFVEVLAIDGNEKRKLVTVDNACCIYCSIAKSVFILYDHVHRLVPDVREASTPNPKSPWAQHGA